MKDLDDITLSDVLPDSIAKDEKVDAASQAIDKQLKTIANMLDIPSIYVNIDRLSSQQLDHIAKQYDVTVWRDSWTVALKRSVLKTAIAEKRKKGTVSAVKEALASISSAASIVEWWQETPKGTPHTFKIYATQANIEGIIPSELQEDLISLIDDAKPLRSHYDFVVQQQARGGINIYGCMRAVAYNSIRSGTSVTAEATGGLGLTAVVRPIIKRHIIAMA
jgi:phage tail P2-like protein